MSYIAQLYTPAQADTTWAAIAPKVRDYLLTGQKLILEIKKAKKSREQEEKYHAMIGEITKAMRSVGSQWEADDWKRLLVDQWRQDNGQKGSQIAPSLDGMRVVQLGLQTRDFKKDEASSFIEWLYAFGADKGITFKEGITQ